MSNPLPFTEDELKQVFDTNLIEYALSQGFDLKKADRHSFQVRKSGGLTLFNNGYFHFSNKEKGNIIDFAKNYQGLSFINAVENILGIRAYTNTIPFEPLASKEKRGIMTLPKADTDTSKTTNYLVNERYLDSEIVANLITQGDIFQAITENQSGIFKNCAFVGIDEDNNPKYCALRGITSNSNFRQDMKHSDKTYGFTMKGTNNRIFVFESPIDCISHATLAKINGIEYKTDHRVSEGCLSDKALTRYLEQNSNITHIVFCYDNDIDGKDYKGNPYNHGQEFAKKCVKRFKEQGYTAYIQTPQNKDFNADLKYIKTSVLKRLKDIEQTSSQTKQVTKKYDREITHI